jgi:hypothetical protein
MNGVEIIIGKQYSPCMLIVGIIKVQGKHLADLNSVNSRQMTDLWLGE